MCLAMYPWGRGGDTYWDSFTTVFSIWAYHWAGISFGPIGILKRAPGFGAGRRLDERKRNETEQNGRDKKVSIEH